MLCQLAPNPVQCSFAEADIACNGQHHGMVPDGTLVQLQLIELIPQHSTQVQQASQILVQALHGGGFMAECQSMIRNITSANLSGRLGAAAQLALPSVKMFKNADGEKAHM